MVDICCKYAIQFRSINVMIEMIGIGNLITIVVYVITMIVGYVRITEKVKVNEKRIDKNCKHIERMENKIKL